MLSVGKAVLVQLVALQEGMSSLQADLSCSSSLRDQVLEEAPILSQDASVAERSGQRHTVSRERATSEASSSAPAITAAGSAHPKVFFTRVFNDIFVLLRCFNKQGYIYIRSTSLVIPSLLVKAS